MFRIQPRLPGAVLDRGQPEPDGAALARLLPALLRLNDAQADRPGHRPAPLMQPDHRDADQRRRRVLPALHAAGQPGRAGPAAGAAPHRGTLRAGHPDGQDFVHYDFAPANLLSDGTAITGVTD